VPVPAMPVRRMLGTVAMMADVRMANDNAHPTDSAIALEELSIALEPPLPGDLSNNVMPRRVHHRELRASRQRVSNIAGIVASLIFGAFAAGHWHSVPASTLRVTVPMIAVLLLTGFGIVGTVMRQHQNLSSSWLSDIGGAATATAIALLAFIELLPLVASHSQVLQLTSAIPQMLVPAAVLVPLARATGRLSVFRTTSERIVILGSGVVTERVRGRIGRLGGRIVVGTVDDFDLGLPGDAHLGRIDDLPRLCDEYRIDRVIVAFSRRPMHEALPALQRIHPRVAISVVPRMFEMLSWQSRLEEIDGLPVLHVAPPGLSLPARTAKRALDIVFAVGVLTVTLPLLALIAVVIRLDSPGPVFFIQERTGRNGRAFPIIKFRTMRVTAEQEQAALQALNEVDGPIFKLRCDPRVTRVGFWLRRLSWDELPQLINVLRGDMSLVGPRPFPVEEAARIKDWHVDRAGVRPGLTGLWQISGRNDLDYDDLRHLDSVYVASWSIWWDLRILLQTPARVWRKSGAY